MSTDQNDIMGDEVAATDIAVVGMAGHFPGARDVSKFWENLCNGIESITHFTDEELKRAGVDQASLRNPNYIKSGAVLPDMEMFDAPFFGFSPRDASIMDPQHRHFLECVWEALESAGHTAEGFSGSIGVFAGSGQHAYLMHNLLTNPSLMQSVGMFLIRHTGNDKDFLTTRASYLLNLTGPSVNIQTACSTSLVAIHIAAQSLLSGECDLALAGGVTIEVPHRRGYEYREGEILSPDGHCRAFDAKSQGTIFGSGVGIVALRRLSDAIEDGDTIHAVIKGSAVNNDGSLKAGYLAPSVEGQAKAISEALAISGIDADSISYVETHGTGTPVGDPIEIAALTQAFRGQTDASGFCGVGSLKTNIGHLDTAAGVAGFIKTVKALETGLMPASLHFETPNPSIDFESSPFYVNNALAEWKPAGVPRRAGVNSLGVGGTNAFVILEEPPALAPTSVAGRPYQLLVLSAKTEMALEAATDNLARHLRQHPDINIADVAYTLQLGRKAFSHRRIVACQNAADAADALERRDPKRVISLVRGQGDPSLVFMFPGGGAQHVNMARELYETEPLYRDEVEVCLKLLRPVYAGDLKGLMFPPAGSDLEAITRELEKPSAALPALFITEYALAKLWMSWGIQPAAMTGHSMGEYTAACLAGVMSLQDALALVALRGALFETLPEGAMLSVRCTEQRLRPLLGGQLDLAAINGPELCLASGPIEAITQLEQALAAQEIEHTRLKISVAAHSQMLEPILEEFGNRVATFRLRPPTLPWMSNLTGTWITAEEATNPSYWVRHLRQGVRFSDGITRLLEDPNRLFLEVGPGQTLASLVKTHMSAKAAQDSVIASARHPRETVSDVQFHLTSLGRLWLAGATPDWSALHDGERRRRIELPTYPFERQRHWIEPGKPAVAQAEAADPMARVSSVDDWFYRPTWERTHPAAVAATPGSLRWLVFKDDLGLGDDIARRLEQGGHTVISVSAGGSFSKLSDAAYVINPAEQADYAALVTDLAQRAMMPQRLIHLWSTVSNDAVLQCQETAALQSEETFDASQALGFYSLLHLSQALGNEDLDEPLHVGIISNQMQSVAGEPVLRPERATLLGPCRVIPREFPNITCQSIDVILPEQAQDASTRETVADQIVTELMSAAGEQIIAFRGGDRWTERFEATSVNEPEAGQSRVRQGGVYLITGGMGGIGLVQAEYLARTARAKLVLVGRTGLPAREEWGQWLTTHAAQDTTSRQIRKVQALEELGAEVLVARADVASVADMRTVVSFACERFGAIHGVIHAAGVLNDGLIQLKAREAAASVLAPKVLGTLVLDTVLADQNLDFFVLFSSTSSILGPAGQVDYVGANAFLNAFAHSKSSQSTTHTVAIDWGVWREVGMAARAAAAGSADQSWPPEGETAGHPLLGIRTVNTPEGVVYRARYSTANQWVLDQHRLPDGQALIPGTGYLEIARAALRGYLGNGPAEITDMFFMSPLGVQDGQESDVRIALEQDGSAYTFTIESDGRTNRSDTARWQEHARATVQQATGIAPRARNLLEIKARCTVSEMVFDRDQRTRQERHISFGPRWRVLRRIDFGADEALALLVLPAQFSGDLDQYTAHPALLDLAIHIGLPLIEGYNQSDDFYVPFACKRVRIWDALPATIYSHVRYRPQSAQNGLAHFDIVVLDARGNVLMEIDDLALKQVDGKALAASPSDNGKTAVRPASAGSRSPQANRDGVPDLLRLGETAGILPAEGCQVLERVLAGTTGPQVIASSLDLHALIEQIGAASQPARAGGAASSAQAQADAGNTYVAPRNDVERKLAAFWQELMGLERVGIHDDFFDLGGYSLIAVRLFAKVKKTFGVDLGLDTLFQASTIAQCAEILAEELGIVLETAATSDAAPITLSAADAPASNGATVPERPILGVVQAALEDLAHSPPPSIVPSRRSNRWSPLVAIQPGGLKAPFFCVHGAGGNVLNLRDLAVRLGSDQPFYGLQAQGVDGKRPPLERIEDMALQYLDEIRRVQPKGPYFLGGYSGGGVIALEMAQRLMRAGEEIALLVFLDTFNPSIQARGLSARERMRNLSEHGVGYVLQWPKRIFDRRAIKSKSSEASSYSGRGQTVPYELRDAHMYESFHQALARYRPTVYPGKVILFRAAVINQIFNHAGPELGWTGLVSGGIEVHEISGTHDTLVLEPNVQMLVSQLSARLAEAQERVGWRVPAGRTT